MPDTPFCLSLKTRLSCHTLSKALEIAKKSALTSKDGDVSKDLRIVSTRLNNWFVVESLGRKPDLFSVIRLYKII